MRRATPLHILAFFWLLSCGGTKDGVGETTPAKIEATQTEQAKLSSNTSTVAWPEGVPTPTLRSIHAHPSDESVHPTVELAIHTNDEKGIPVLWGESLLTRLHHKGFTAKGRHVHFRSYDEIDGMIEIARVAKRSPIRFGEVRLIAEESTSDARIRILVRELECKEWKSRILAPLGKVGINEAEMMRLSEAVEVAVTEALVQGFSKGFCE